MKLKNFRRVSDARIVLALACAAMFGCGRSGGSAAAVATPKAAAADTKAYKVDVTVGQALIPAKSTAAAGESSCTLLQVKILDGAAPGKAVKVALSVQKVSGEDPGKVSASELTTDDSGLATTNYCAGDGAGVAMIAVQAGVTSVNSKTIETTKKNVYTIVYFAARSLLANLEAQTPGSAAKDVPPAPSELSLSLADYPEGSCGSVEFVVNKNGARMSGANVTFESQDLPPQGVKFALRDAEGTSKINPLTNRKYLTFAGTTDASGNVKVPICSGFSPGIVNVTASFAASAEDAAVSARGPAVKINGSIPSYASLSVTYDQKNARSVPGSFTSNSKVVQNFVAELGARLDFDALLLRNWGLGILSEIGREFTSDSGIPDDKNQVKFSLEFTNLGSLRPVAVNPQYSVVCHPEDFPADIYPTGIPMRDLAKNWRNSVTYYTKGQEFFYDKNGDGKYLGPSEGFWDVNENGIFDIGIDVLTSDLSGNGIFDADAGSGEWFIDLPTPFVDSNENGIYDASETVLGGKYEAPNGKWDSFSTIWKHFYTPLFMGTSTYSQLNNMIGAGSTGGISSTLGAFFTKYGYDGVMAASPATTRVGTTVNFASTLLSVSAARYLFVQDVCGNPVPGGTEIEIGTLSAPPASYGDRNIFASISEQPGDQYLDLSRSFLASYGGAKAKINFNVGLQPNEAFNHPVGKEGYPLQISFQAASCNNVCKGPGSNQSQKACGAKSAAFQSKLDTGISRGVVTLVELPSVGSCSCDAATAMNSSPDTCVCKTGFQESGGACVPL